MKLNPYITFAGNAEEALNFYKECLQGEIRNISRYVDAPLESPDDYKQKIMHAVLAFGTNLIMAADVLPGKTIPTEGNIRLSVDIIDPVEMDKVFNALSTGGVITMPIQETFWGARFGMLRDRFGIEWMFNCELPKKN